MRILFIALLFTVSLFAKEIAVVANPNFPKNSLTEEEVYHFFLEKNPQLNSGEQIIPIEWSNNQLKSVFYESISGKTLGQLKAYWASFMFTGKGRPPKQLATTDDVLLFLQSNANAVSYLDASEINTQVKILYRIK